MKPRWLALPCLLALGPATEAQTASPSPTPTARSVVKTEALRLILQDTAVRSAKVKTRDDTPPVPPSEETLILEPFTVWEKRIVPLPPPLPTTELKEFFRTGTIFQKVGRKTTFRFGASGDKGLTLSFSR